MINIEAFPFCSDENYDFVSSDDSTILKSSELTPFNAFNVFRDTINILSSEKWEASSFPAHIGREYIETQFLTHFSILLPESLNYPRNFHIEYSIDGFNWIVIQSYSNISMGSGWNRFQIQDPFRFEEPYRFIRLKIDSTQGSKVSIQRLKFFTREVSSINTKAIRQFCSEYDTGEVRHYSLNTSCSGEFDSRDNIPSTLNYEEIEGNFYSILSSIDDVKINTSINLNTFYLGFNTILSRDDSRVLLSTREKLSTDGFILKLESNKLIVDESGNFVEYVLKNEEIGTNVYLSLYVEEFNLFLYVNGIKVKELSLNERLINRSLNLGQKYFTDDISRSSSSIDLPISSIFFNTMKLPFYNVLPEVDLSRFFKDISRSINITSSANPIGLDLLLDNSHISGHWEFPKDSLGRLRITPSTNEVLSCLEIGVGFTERTTNLKPSFPNGKLYDIYQTDNDTGFINNNDSIIIDSNTGTIQNTTISVIDHWIYDYDPTLERNVLRKISASDSSALVLPNLATNFGSGDFTYAGYFYASSLIQPSHFGIFGNIGVSGKLGIGVVVRSMKFGLWGGDNTTTPIWLDSTKSVLLNTWYHIEVTRKSNVTRLFVDGIKVLETSAIVNINNTGFVLGGTYTSGGFSGYDDIRLSDISIFNTALHEDNFTVPNYRLKKLEDTYLSINELKITKELFDGSISSSIISLPRDGRVTEPLDDQLYQRIDLEVVSYRPIDISSIETLTSGDNQTSNVDVTTNKPDVNYTTTRTDIEPRKILMNDGDVNFGNNTNSWYSNLSETQNFFMRFNSEKLLNVIELSLDNTIIKVYRVKIEGSNDEINYDDILLADITFNPGKNSIPISPSIKYKTYRITLLDSGV